MQSATKNCVIYLIITLVVANYTTALPGNNSLRAQFMKALIRRGSANDETQTLNRRTAD